MKVSVIPYRDWILTVDCALTHATYATVKNGSADGCECFDCKNYVLSRDSAFPAEIKMLFDQLGIDYKKENEVSRFYKNTDGLHLYCGFFHFKGSFEGQNCTVPIAGTPQHTLLMTPINENFSIGFTYDSSLAYFEDDKDLVQVEFEVRLPWLISKENESD